MPYLFAMEVTDGAVIIASISAIGSLAVIVTNFLVSRSQQRATWRREDMVAKTLKIVSAQQREDSMQLQNTINEVHTLVNGKLTESLQNQARFLTHLVALRSADISRLGTDADPGAVVRRDEDIEDLNRLNRVLADREATEKEL